MKTIIVIASCLSFYATSWMLTPMPKLKPPCNMHNTFVNHAMYDYDAPRCYFV